MVVEMMAWYSTSLAPLLACLPILHRRKVKKLCSPDSLAARMLSVNIVLLIQIYLGEIWKMKLKRSKALGQPFFFPTVSTEGPESRFSPLPTHTHTRCGCGASTYKFSISLSEAKRAAPQAGQFCRVVLELFLEA